MEFLHAFVYWAVVACLVYLCLVYGAFLLLLLPASIEARFLARQGRHEDFEAIEDSEFTIPVSIIAPAYNEAVVIVSAIRSLLSLRYPLYELVVVNDGSTDDTMEVLTRVFDLKPRETFVRRVFRCRPVRGMYVSRLDPRLIVVDKENGGKSDALNAGLNVARYRYVCTVDSDTVFFPDCLARGMRLILRDPATVVGLTSYVAISRRPEDNAGKGLDTKAAQDTMLTKFQYIDYLRAFLNGRLGWSRLDFMLCTIGVFAIWRRDVVVKLGGFASNFTCEDIEFTFRVHEHFRRTKQPYRVLALGEAVGRTEGPDSVRSLISQRERWQRVITETVWHYRRMLLNPKYGAVGLMGMPYYVLAEVLAPVFQVLSVIVLPIALWIGDFTWLQFVFFTLAVAFANGFLTNMALLLHDFVSRSGTLRGTAALMWLGPLDLFFYRPILVYAQAKGLFRFLTGDKAWHKFERNRRGDPPPAPAQVANSGV